MTPDPTRLGRRAAERAKRRRQRRRLLVVGVAAVLALLVTASVTVLVGGDDGDPAGDGPTRTQRTILLQVKDAKGLSVATALLAHDEPSGTGSVVLIPPQVLVTVPGTGSSQFGRVLQTGSVTGARNAIEDLLGITIDSSWVLESAAFSRFVDELGGVRVTVDVPVLQGRTLVVAPGTERLDGGRALLFATYLAAGEQEQTRLARLQTVLDAVVTSLPPDVARVIGVLGEGSQATAGIPAVAEMLTGLKKDDGAAELQYRSLPVVKVDVGNDETRFRLDTAAAQTLVDELLAQSVPPGVRSEGNRVLVLNGVGTPGLGEKVRAKLVPAGFVFVGSRNANAFNQCCTQVLVKQATAEGTALGNRVATALGVPLSSVKSSNQIGTIADVVVIVGKDFKAK